MNRMTAIGGVALLALGTAACGRMADLEAPQARETERAPRSAEAESLPEPATINLPPTQQPIDGGPNNPFGGAGAYPEPDRN